MRLTVRGKLIVLVASATLSFLFVGITAAITATRVSDRLLVIREQYVPKIELRPRLESEFERMRRGMQDAIAAQDSDALEATHESLDRFRAMVNGASGAIDRSLASQLLRAIEQYFAAAYEVSRRMLADESGEEVVDAMSSMPERQQRVLALIERATAMRENELDEAFAAVVAEQLRSVQILVATSVISLLFTILIAWWVSRSVLRSVGELTSGFSRFGKGIFDQPITIIGNDELAEAASRANEMARNLDALGKAREHDQWLKAGRSDLTEQLRGELELDEVGARALRVLAAHLDAPVGALYFASDGATLDRVAQYAGEPPGPEKAVLSFRVGEGLIGQVAKEGSITILDDPPSDYLRVRSGLGDCAPRAIALVPLTQDGKSVGVLELGLLHEWSQDAQQLLESVSETLAIALQVASSRRRLRELLDASRAQALQLASQEEELRATNDELQVQQEELRHANDALTEQTRELETQRAVVEKKNAELEVIRRGLEQKASELATVSTYKSQFLTNMSHELRTPLNSMLLLSSLMSENRERNLSDKQVEYCKTIHSAGNDLLGLINQVLDLAKVESGKQDVVIEPVSIGPLITQLRGVFEPLATAKGLKLSIELEGQLPETITTDRQRINQILTNLLGNAIKFTEKGSVALRVSHDRSRMMRFAVTDTGIGIRPADRARVFEPFEQADPSTGRRHGGTGLGLAISREVAALLGGELVLEDTPGPGSTFALYLPAGAETEIPRERPLRSSEPTILVIEDDPSFARSLREVVESQSLRCITASTGEEGLRLAKSVHPTGVVLDLGLPDVHGFAVMERLQGDPDTAAIPVHVVSGFEASDRARVMGAAGYLTKPCTHKELARMVRSLVSPPADQTMRVLVVEDDPITGASLVELLSRESFETMRVASAEEAIGALGTQSFHCMVLDLSLPHMSGLELLAHLEAHDLPKPAVIVYTARTMSRAEVQRLEAYAEAVVLKQGSSTDRLLDEIRIFARKLADGVPRAAPLAPPDADQLRGRTILVVDDDMRTVYALSAMLRSRGAEVSVAENGRDALLVLEKQAVPDAVLMDIMMPEMDGYTAMGHIRKNPRLASLPIVALTAKAMKGDLEKCIEAGASAYLPKPIDPQKLFALLSVQLEKAAR